jgi:NTP pyrophosphatase (non-canonical NTP hydrolase)
VTGRRSAQRRVRTTIEGLGGYWRPSAGALRVLEELGELASLQHPSDIAATTVPAATVDEGGLASELADLWIITTALADQFLAEVAEPYECSEHSEPSFARLVAAAGEIARVVNYYDGPKAPGRQSALPSLHDAVTSFHSELRRFAVAAGVELAAAVDAKLDAIAGRDRTRFARGREDPRTAACIEEFRAAGGAGEDARLWGLRLQVGRASAVAAEAGAALRSFSRAAGPERLDGFVLAFGWHGDQSALDVWVQALLKEVGVALCAEASGTRTGAKGTFVLLVPS